ncbi:hypothetical protein AB9F29_03845 [Falsihalocynthiibacter sp. S25ZX9]|uniref:COG3904 family protein n=1 Tax=Falsihalocynthiibacter sp. S25ZX9 TaxID=3240870 RepID=UPI00350F1503
MKATFLASIVIGSLPVTGLALEFDIIRFNASVIITLDGDILAGDADRFANFWDENAYDAYSFTVALNSSGGSLSEGLKLGRFLRRNGVATAVQKYSQRAPMQSNWDYSFAAKPLEGSRCYSVCALAFMGGVERSVPERARIGFHQFYGGVKGRSADDTMITTQAVSATISSYLREMGAASELFELMSMTPPEEMYIPEQQDLGALGIHPISAFQDFRLMPKEGGIVAISTNPRNLGSLERVYELETFCWKGRPMINLYAEGASSGLPSKMADPMTTHIDGWWIETVVGSTAFGSENIRLYPEQKLLATLILDPETAKALSKGNSKFSVNSYTASGVFMSGVINAPEGDLAIAASFKGCL